MTQDVRVVPIDALTSEFVAAKLGDDHDVEDDFSRGRGYVRQKPGHRLECVKLRRSSSTICPSPMTRLMGKIFKSSGHEGIKSSR